MTRSGPRNFLAIYIPILLGGVIKAKDVGELLEKPWGLPLLAAALLVLLALVAAAFFIPADSVAEDPSRPQSIYKSHRRRWDFIAALLLGFVLGGGIFLVPGRWILQKGRGTTPGYRVPISSPASPLKTRPLPPPAWLPPSRLAHLTRSVAESYTRVPGDHAMTVLDDDGCRMKVRWRGVHDLVVEDGEVTYPVEPESDAEERLVRMFHQTYTGSIVGFLGDVSRAIREGRATVRPGPTDSYHIDWDQFSITARLSADSLLNELLVSERGAETPKYRLEITPSEPGGFRGTGELAAALRTVHAGL